MQIDKGLRDLVIEATSLALRAACSTRDPSGAFFDTRDLTGIDEKLIDTIFGYADGLTQKYLSNMMSGRCSLSAKISFDIAAFEEKVKKDIIDISSLVHKFGEPKQLTPEDMRARGYTWN